MKRIVQKKKQEIIQRKSMVPKPPERVRLVSAFIIVNKTRITFRRLVFMAIFRLYLPLLNKELYINI